MRKLFKKVLCSVLCLAMLLSCLSIGPLSAMAVTMTDYGKNPDPDVDIAVSVPADYPGTFDDFKAELSAALVAQGMDPTSFRITDTAVKIDTTNLDGWYVYDHYYNDAAYRALGLSAEQQKRQPFRQADNTCVKSINPTPCLIQDVFVAKRWGNPGNKLYPFNQHTYSWETNGRANMCFAGYGTNALTDYMFYPAPSDSRRTIEFDLDCAVIDIHTLQGAGFLLNTAISGGKLAGYAFYYEWVNATTANAQIRKLQNVDVNFAGSPGTSLVSKSVTLSSGTKLRIRVVLERNKVTVTQRVYNGNTMGDEVVLFDNYPIPVLPAAGNGFGPVVAYKSHGCSSMTYFQFGDLAMTYDSTAFDALKEVQYVQSADQKYFVNLVPPESNETGIPDASKDSEGYVDGITRMDQNEIFYVSNKDDGRVGTDDDGIGATNTIYTSTETDFIQELASKIVNNYNEKKIFTHINPPDREAPLSDFYIINSTPDENGAINGSQLMTVHQRHLINTNTSVKVSLRDKSRLGNMPTSGTKLAKYEVKLIDPDGNDVEILNDGRKVIELTPDADGNVNFPDYTVDSRTKPGRYTFSMNVTDNNGKESGWVSTYFTVFDDSAKPIAKGENTTRNRAKIHLTDTGQGIDNDGITFISDNRGSGVAAYYITDNESQTDSPLTNPDLWVYLDEPVHEYEIDIDLTEYTGKGKKLVVYYMDECKNSGEIAVFKPVHVIVEGPGKEPIDDYYIIGETPVIVLPDDVPEHGDPDYEFSNWEIVPPGDDNPPGSGDPITSGKEIPVDPKDDQPTITIKPAYTDHKVSLTYIANATGATIPETEDGKGSTYTTQIVEKSDLAAKIKAQNIVPVREGYDFKGWYLDAACTEEIKDQIAATNTTVYAKWEIASYNIIFDHNGGGTSGKNKFENVPYGTKLSLIATKDSQYEVKANEAPTKPGYIFKFWTLEKDKPETEIKTSTPDTMPAKDKTVYAYYVEDTSKYVVKFDTQGGNNIANKAYAKSATNYGTLQKPVKSGYVFEGWYLKNADGTMSDQKVELSGSNIPSELRGNEHTLMAKWSPAQNTPYNVAYYYNSGNKDAKGNYIYVKANNMTKTYTAPTESEVTIPQEAILDGLEGGDFTFSRSYWLNDKVRPQDRTGIVKGGEPLELKLYYDRYFTVTTQVVSGDGTGRIWSEDEGYDFETDTLKVKEGETPTIKWQPAEGYHTANVALDNRLRDNLIKETSYTFEEEIHKDYYFRVRFEEGTSTLAPFVKDYYTIATSIEGCYDGSCTITPTGRYVAGRDSVEIEWDINEDVYRIQSIQIDQTIFFRSDTVLENYKKVHPDYKEKHINLVADPTFADGDFTRFRRISQDHKVIVTVDKIPTVGGNVTQGFYTVTVNTYGGNEEVASQVVSSQVLKEKTQFNAGPSNRAQNNVTSSEFDIVAIYIDGVRLLNSSGVTTNDFFNKYNFTNYRVNPSDTNSPRIFNSVTANHVIDIYFADKGTPPDKWHSDAEEDEIDFNKLNTKIVGGPGTISSGGYVATKDNERTVSWKIQDGESLGEDPDKTVDGKIVPNENYSVYELDTVTVTKTVYDEKGKPVKETETITYGTDTVEITKTVMDEETGKPVIDEETGKPMVTIETKDRKDYEKNIDLTVDKETEVVVSVKPAYRTVTVLKYGNGTTSETKTFFRGQSYNDIIGTPNKGTELVKLVVDGKVQYDYYENAGTEKTSLFSNFINMLAGDDDDFSVNNVDANGTSIDIPKLDRDHVVEVYFADIDTKTEKPKPLPETTYRVLAYANISDVAFDGQGIFAEGDDPFVSWKAPTGYEVEYVTLNGEKVTDTYSISLPDITSDQTIFVNFVKTDDPTTKVPLKGDPSPNNLFKVETEIVGGKGIITESKSYAGGENATITWKAEDEQVITTSYFVKQAENPDLTQAERDKYANYVTLIGERYTAEGRLPGQLNYPVDTDGDGVTDIILNWDYAGDGIPEYNIVLNGIQYNDNAHTSVKDYHIDMNYAPLTTDAEGNIVPDESNLGTAVDYDGTSHAAQIVDINSTVEREKREFRVKYVIVDGVVLIDREYDNDTSWPKYDDTTGMAVIPGNSYTFNDLDKDHKIVVVIGTNPNTNLPPNVDIDGDGIPDINIDIDGDGIPDVNVDKDGDGVPDLNISDPNKDDDGKEHDNWVPDRSIDTDKPTMKIPDPDDPTKEIEVPNPGYLREDTNVTVNYVLKDTYQKFWANDDLGKSDMGDEYNTLPYLLEHLGLDESDIKIVDKPISEDRDGDGNAEVLMTRSYIVITNKDKLNNTFKAWDENEKETTYNLADFEIYCDDEYKGTTKSMNDRVSYRFAPMETKVNVEFIQVDGEKKTTKVEVPGHVFDNYTFAVNNEYVTYINAPESFGYKLIDTAEYPAPTNAEGTMTLEPITVKYYFALMDTQIIVRLEDEAGNLVADGGLAHIDGGKKYNEDYNVTAPSSVQGYILDRTQIPENAHGTVKEDLITVTFKYLPKDAEVTVRFVDADGKDLIKPDTVKGKYKEAYTTTPENIPGYVLVKTPANAKGVFAETKDNADVVYEYARAAQVIVKHIDRNGKEIVEPETFNYVYGDTYEVKPISNDKYKAYGVIGSATGKIDQDTIVVVYLYNEVGSTDPTPTNPVTPIDPTPTNPTPTNPTPTKPTVNIDIDGDGVPDINIDKDGDGVPDVNIDKDGDGDPDEDLYKHVEGDPD